MFSEGMNTTECTLGRKEGNVFYLTTHTKHFIIRLYGRERNVLFNDALNTFYLRLYGVRHMVKDHSDSERKPGAAT